MNGCVQCSGTGQEYPYGHEGDDEWLQRCGACNGSGDDEFPRPYNN